jgi:hypothetical protein
MSREKCKILQIFTNFRQFAGFVLDENPISEIRGKKDGPYCNRRNQRKGHEDRHMLRGTQKHMIVVRTRNSPLFEEAYFVMRRTAAQPEADCPDMLWEANRIIENSLPCSQEAIQRRIPWERLRRGMWFALGSLFGGGTVGLLWWLM